tara:strand:+ start:2518 stop:3555 length:1038 start_codon:yes stop_codon:yes gene_type:complete
MSRILNFILVFLMIVACYGLSRMFDSYREQVFLLQAVNSDDYSIDSDEKWADIQNLEVEFPNISATAVPLKSIQAQFYLYNDSVDKGIEILNKSISNKDNPYIMLSEALKAKVFNTYSIIDSSYIYARKAFEGLPRNPFHYAELTRALKSINQPDSITYFFKKIKYPYDEMVWRVYLNTMRGMQKNKDSIFLIETANEALTFAINKTDPNNITQIAAYMTIHGENNVLNALEMEEEAAELLNGDNFLSAKTFYEKLLELVPSNVIYKENYALIQFNLKFFSDVVTYLMEVENQGHNLDGIQEFMLGISNYNIGNNSESCSRLLKSSQLNFEEANNAYKILCNINP